MISFIALQCFWQINCEAPIPYPNNHRKLIFQIKSITVKTTTVN